MNATRSVAVLCAAFAIVLAHVADARELTRGSRGAEVRALQTLLNAHRRSRGVSAIGVDGIFGPRTEAALREEQRRLGLPETGRVELPDPPVRRGALGALNDLGQPVRRGDRGKTVKALQEAINRHRRQRGLAPIAEDGIFGPRTESALRGLTGTRTSETALPLLNALLPPADSLPAGTGDRDTGSLPAGTPRDTGSRDTGSRDSGSRDSDSRDSGSPPPPPTRRPSPPDTGSTSTLSGWKRLHAGLLSGVAPIPARGQRNDTLRRALGVAVEPHGETTSLQGYAFVRGTVSWFGSSRDRGVSSTETGAITLERLRLLNEPRNPSASFARRNAERYYYVAMRFNYAGIGKRGWRGQRILVVNPSDPSRAVVVRPVDWGPHTRTGRVIDLSPQALRDLGLVTDQNALISFARPDAPLGVVRD